MKHNTEWLKREYTASMFSLLSHTSENEEEDILIHYKNGLYHDELNKCLSDDDMLKLCNIAIIMVSRVRDVGNVDTDNSGIKI